MTFATGWPRRTPLALLSLLAACASAGAPASPAPLAPVAAETPRITVAVLPSTRANWVDATFRVSDDAYALVLEMDRDRGVRVLFPESPSDVALAKGGERHAFLPFFAGFGNTSFGGASRFRSALYTSALSRITPFEGGGVLIGIASDRPLQLERLVKDGDWDEDAIQELLFERSVPEGVHVIGRTLTVPGQEFTSNFQFFSASRQNAGFASFASTGCLASTFGDDFPSRYVFNGDAFGVPSRVPVARFTVGNQAYVRYAESDGCGHVTFYEVPEFRLPPKARPPVRPDTNAVPAYRGARATAMRLTDPLAQRRLLDGAVLTSGQRATAGRTTDPLLAPRSKIFGTQRPDAPAALSPSRRPEKATTRPNSPEPAVKQD